MPFRSKAQARRFFAMERRGELPRGTARRWAHETPGGIRSLPERLSGDDKPSFWQQYGGEILVGVITAVVSAVATYYAMRAVEKRR